MLALGGAIVFLTGILLGGRLINYKETIFRGQETYEVKRIIDGDTFEIENKQLVRLTNINAPELGNCYGAEAKKALAELIEGKTVRLEKDISGDDKFGRLLRYVIVPAARDDKDDLFVNYEMVRAGAAFAEPYPPDVRYRKLMYEAENTARENNSGLWAACDYQTKNETERELDLAPSTDNCLIKGNHSRKSKDDIYTLPGCPNYESIKIDPRNGDTYFCTEAEALEAGFRKAKNCN